MTTTQTLTGTQIEVSGEEAPAGRVSPTRMVVVGERAYPLGVSTGGTQNSRAHQYARTGRANGVTAICPVTVDVTLLLPHVARLLVRSGSLDLGYADTTDESMVALAR